MEQPLKTYLLVLIKLTESFVTYFYVKIYKCSIIKPVMKHLNENVREQNTEYQEQ